MFYKPTYCCNCGDKIERIEWKILTSRRFCELCETYYKFGDWFPRILGATIIVFGMLGLGSFLEPNEKRLLLDKNGKEITRPAFELIRSVRHGNSNLPATKSGEVVDRGSDKLKRSDLSPGSIRREISERQAVLTGKEIKNPQKVGSEPVYFCGAETRKGSPCSRKVKGGGRCWQHQGRKAVLPLKDLLVKDK